MIDLFNNLLKKYKFNFNIIDEIVINLKNFRKSIAHPSD